MNVRRRARGTARSGQPKLRVGKRAAVHLGVAAVCRNSDGAILLGRRRDTDLWDLPAGAVLSGEAPWDAVRRELREETFLDGVVIALTGVYLVPAGNELLLVFSVDIAPTAPRPSDEFTSFSFVSPDHLPPDLSPKRARQILDAVSLGAPALRVLYGPLRPAGPPTIGRAAAGDAPGRLL